MRPIFGVSVPDTAVTILKVIRRKFLRSHKAFFFALECSDSSPCHNLTQIRGLCHSGCGGKDYFTHRYNNDFRGLAFTFSTSVPLSEWQVVMDAKHAYVSTGKFISALGLLGIRNTFASCPPRAKRVGKYLREGQHSFQRNIMICF